MRKGEASEETKVVGMMKSEHGSWRRKGYEQPFQGPASAEQRSGPLKQADLVQTFDS